MADALVSDKPPGQPSAPATAHTRLRLQSIDILRGIVIVLMALDHVRDYFNASAFLFDPLDLQKTSLALYLTRWITHFCAPTFMFLAGASAFLHGRKIGSRAALSRFLLTRGLWLIFLEFTVVAYAWNFSLYSVALLVIWALGVSMMALAALVWLPLPAIIGFGVLLIVGHNAFDHVTPASMGQFGPLWALLHNEGSIRLWKGFDVWVLYPLVPWIGVMALGYGLGFVFLQDAARRFKTLTVLGLSMIAGFLLLRAGGLYGDPRAWTMHADPWATVGDFLNVRKYPPSLLYLLVTLGPVLMLLPWLERVKGFGTELLASFGRVPLFFYVLHLYLAHALMLAIGMAMGYPAGIFVGVMAEPKTMIEIGWGFSLPVTYCVWLLILAILYPACRWFGELKRRRHDWWLGYL